MLAMAMKIEAEAVDFKAGAEELESSLPLALSTGLSPIEQTVFTPKPVHPGTKIVSVQVAHVSSVHTLLEGTPFAHDFFCQVIPLASGWHDPSAISATAFTRLSEQVVDSFQNDVTM